MNLDLMVNKEQSKVKGKMKLILILLDSETLDMR
jgi:hypothetical protein